MRTCARDLRRYESDLFPFFPLCLRRRWLPRSPCPASATILEKPKDNLHHVLEMPLLCVAMDTSCRWETHGTKQARVGKYPDGCRGETCKQACWLFPLLLCWTESQEMEEGAVAPRRPWDKLWQGSPSCERWGHVSDSTHHRGDLKCSH